MNNTFVFRKDEAEHNTQLEAVLRCIKDAGVTLNPKKCKFSKRRLTFLGHVID